METTLITLLQEFGLLVCLVLFFTWQGWKREQRLSARIDTLEKEYTEALKETIVATNRVISENTEMMRRLEKHLNNGS
jgi:hypothetical protein